ncbi:TPA: acylneuraminate cytidylyltransferase family protein [Enterobacter cloacae]|uniref:acylneuraminate cytidylyltransferase family protein n=1 Tax=Enterobacter cloacae TaxID=550 RepID=UPI0012527ACB|nr:acylneuraminate cytidylyltransferase family protein [Enterobacter cloacae]VAM11647.1 3-deoxy-manno-octulosonate cytidylyltransferase [Enterobacter kobei]MCK7317390.1 acylneuraminate cytidylyltransferase family protein [Enterobacter cloacae]UDF99414.1 acylneuraminate cytidylyltransferase family protein [Enterobacter cloacae]VAC86772.1 3-deoxy-manno-octulosonate cytidylyltransferase [Enterobacter cloacae]HCC8047071.1 acylneuraminate cytidylyltransferase family protein [Enterobacter cloacae]
MPIDIAIIPARAGSKRLANKNIKLLGGKPLIAWTIEAAINSGNFDLILVSTDSQEIADVAIAAGASVPFLRPAELASDTASTNDVVSHMVNWVEEHHDIVNLVTILQPTSPLREAKDIQNAMVLYAEKKATAVVSVCEVEHPIEYCNHLPADCSLNGFLSKASLKRSQDFEITYRLNGAIYIFDRKFVGALSEIYSEGSYAYIMKKEKSVDIDDEFDFKLAEFIKAQCSVEY